MRSNQISRRVLAHIALGLIVVACPAWANGQTVLKSKYLPGASYKQTQAITLKQTLTLNGQAIETAADQTIVTVQKQGAADAEGKIPVEIKVDALSANISLQGGLAINFNSANPDAKAANPLLEPVLDAMRKQLATVLKFSVDKLNKVSTVEGVQEGTQMDPADLQSDLQQDLDRFPNEPIQPGHTWERTEKIHVGGGQVFTVKRKYEYVGSAPLQPTVPDGKKVEKITYTDQEIVLAIEPGKGVPAEVKKSDLKPGKSGGTLLLDNERGVVVSAEGDLNVTGDLELSAMNQPIAAKLNLSMKTKVTVE